MMKQAVNLYQPEVKPTGVWTLGAMLRMVLAAVLLLSGYAALRGWQVNRVQAQIGVLEGERSEYLASLENWKKVEEAQRPLELEQRLADLERERQRQNQILERLRRTDLGNLSGFSPYLEGLARARVNGLWLTDIVLTAGGREVALGGHAHEEPRVPELVERLGSEDAYKGLVFRSLQMSREAEPASSPVRFWLATQDAKPRGEPVRPPSTQASLGRILNEARAAAAENPR